MENSKNLSAENLSTENPENLETIKITFYSLERKVLMAATLNGILRRWDKAGERFYFSYKHLDIIDAALKNQYGIFCNFFINGQTGNICVKDMKTYENPKEKVHNCKYARLHPKVCQLIGDYLLERV